MTVKEMFEEVLNDPQVDASVKDQLKVMAANDQIAGLKLSARKQAEYEALAAEKEKYSQAVNDWQSWHERNRPVIDANLQALTAYKERYGDLTQPDKASPAAPSREDYDKLTQELQTLKASTGNLVPQVSGVFGAAQKLMWKHLKAGRETDFDLNAITDIASKKYGGNIESAYDEWDRPEAEKARQKAEDARVEKRAKELMAQRESQRAFPGASDGFTADTSPLARGLRVVGEKDKPDDTEARRRSMINALAGIDESGAA